MIAHSPFDWANQILWGIFMSRTYFVANDGELYSTDPEGVTVRLAEGWQIQSGGDEDELG